MGANNRHLAIQMKWKVGPN